MVIWCRRLCHQQDANRDGLKRPCDPCRSQVYNNYGPKSNEELIFSYGFILDPNVDDVVVLRLGVASLAPHIATRLRVNGLNPDEKFLLRRDGKLPHDLLAIMRHILGDKQGVGVDRPIADDDMEESDPHEAHEADMRSVELELDVLGSLGAMLEAKVDKLPADTPTEAGDDIRENIRRMVEAYIRGERMS